MKWTRIRIKTTTEAEDIIISELYDIGLEGAQIEDKVPLSPLEKEQMFVDILPQTEPDDGVAYLSFFVEEDSDMAEDIDALTTQVKDVLESISEYMDIGEGSISIDETEDLDWINNWKKYFHQFYIDDLLVIPSWEEVLPKDKDKMILHIDPGTAFGTGMHETTKLCIRAMKKYLKPGDKILDVGTGSGILAILSLMYGAGYSVGTDLDTCTIEAVKENKAANGINDKDFDLIIGNIIDDATTQDKVRELIGEEGADIVMANILAPILIALAPVIPAFIRKGGVLISSGIIEGKENEVADAYRAAGLDVVDISSLGDWRSVTAIKR
ncbi:MAG: 50S ribosomal protein L11 methyltransferase [Lachnospiraceae bacterium]|nr:50S ribosomal protein L11 methyltransferase [Lachnospiraceae bacterium]